MKRTLVVLTLAAAAGRLSAQGLQPPPVPPANPITPAKTLLGKTLFWDEQLSATGTMACATCHVPGAGGSDPRSRLPNGGNVNPGADGLFATPDDVIGSPGVIRNLADGSLRKDPIFGLLPQVTGRKAPTFINAAYSRNLFWDGRAPETFRDPVTQGVVLQFAAALESQAAAPPVNDAEMAHEGADWPSLAARVSGVQPLDAAAALTPDLAAWLDGRSYPELFQEAFGSPDVTPARVSMAIATYERTLFSNQAPIDDFLSGNPGALTLQEQRGFNLFNSPRASCNACHTGPVFSNDSFRYIGVRPQGEDEGRAAVTGNPADQGRMKVPTLRNVELRAPYFHNGRFNSLEQVVDFYNRGGDFAGPNKDPLIRPLNLTPAERADLLAFLRRPLTDPRVRDRVAPFDEPVLYSQSSFRPQVFGLGTAGSGGFVPAMVALEPPYFGNPNLTWAVDRGNPGGSAYLVVDIEEVTSGWSTHGVIAYLTLTGKAQVFPAGTLLGSGLGGGYASVNLPSPTSTALIGRPLAAQWLLADPGGPQGFSASPAARFTVY